MGANFISTILSLKYQQLKTGDAKNCVEAWTNKFLHKPGLILFAEPIFRNSQEHLCNNRQILRTLSYMKIIYCNKLKQHCNYFLRLKTNKLLTSFSQLDYLGCIWNCKWFHFIKQFEKTEIHARICNIYIRICMKFPIFFFDVKNYLSIQMFPDLGI